MILNIFLVVVIILILSIILEYNHFIRLGNAIKERTSAIDVLLKQRFDMLPNIIECVKGYAKHEKTTFEDLAKLRSEYNNNRFSVGETEKINKGFASIMALAENYPELKANEQFLSLQDSLIKIENNINYARLDYNETVTLFNNAVESVPSNIVAKIFGFEKQELFKVEDNEKQNIKVEL